MARITAPEPRGVVGTRVQWRVPCQPSDGGAWEHLLARVSLGRLGPAGQGERGSVVGLLLLPAWARSRGAKLGWFGYSGQMPLFFSSVFFSFSISYFYPTLCHGFLTLEYMCCQHVYLLVWSSRGHLRL